LKLAGGAQDRRLLVWNLKSVGPPQAFEGHAYPVRDVVFHPDSNKVTTLGADGTVRVFWLDLVELKAHGRKLLKNWWK
jgi:WD40 repeat protein